MNVVKPPSTVWCPGLLGQELTDVEAEDLSRLLKALADPVRLRLVSIAAAAATGEVCACDLPSRVRKTQATVSHHLSVLVDAGVLSREQRGKWAWFSIRADRLEGLRNALAVPVP
ncbi:MAG TPA: metalloregulator ArsR/SmtB family transcription factor [Acidimicrobiales bacterium]|nr:metalloregulator ArsR/SmtB family transcription factor [Acidimicrobiales bacterium]